LNNLIIEFVNNIVDKNAIIAYIVFFIVAFLQMVFPPIPGDMLLVFQGYITCISEKINVCGVFINAYIATFIGSVIVYKLGYNKGYKVLEYKFISKFISVKNQEKTKKMFSKYGFVAIILSKFLLGINAIIILFAGIFKVKPRIVYLSLLVSIFVHHMLYIGIGRIVAQYVHTNTKVLASYYGRFAMFFSLFTIIIIGAIVFLIAIRGTSKPASLDK
jgi:membrane protein DedA with SNARE-associated domain